MDVDARRTSTRTSYLLLFFTRAAAVRDGLLVWKTRMDDRANSPALVPRPYAITYSFVLG